MGLRSTKRQQLQGMQQAVPLAQEQAAGQQAQTLQALQQGTRQATLGGAVTTKQQVQQAAGALTQAQADVGVQARAQGIQTQRRIAEEALQEKATTAQLGLQQRELALQRNIRTITNRLNSINRDYTQEVYTQNMQFRKDELGRTLLNERQLADYALLSAKREEDFKDFQMKQEEYHSRKLAFYKLGYQRMEMELKNQFAKSEQERDHSLIMELRELEYEYKKRYAEEQAKAANSLSRNVAMGSIFGAGVGGAIGILGGPMGVVAGAIAGKAIGGGIASAVSK